ncbi:SDR family oxidoreductase [Acetobacter tropicalis]|nr:SDR family oxidoreductase [Acetobacter tropicalis]KAA8388582.1 SDR family oxidoreductase [Acetobacter tropicalis]KAA8388703.1 SDR family oxidoreductase [Acetobacter tropicalis]MBC9009859.1 SDR family oxidoreductase [Acetobacter tropicalis]MDO8172292.1 SDR family oxidoreductase [Acetobacter tropicalis]
MHILVIGNMGYVGPVVCRHLRNQFPDAHISGYDTALFADHLTCEGPVPEIVLNEQHFGDVRRFSPSVLNGVDAVIYLAAISNDPMGQKFGKVTDEVNRESCITIARLSILAGVRHFAFASSCSVYGYASEKALTENDATNPLTAYARSKIEAENDLKKLATDKMFISCLRFATACGFSERLRLDLVLNDFVATALRTKKIHVLSDGSPWRPLIDIRDMARIFEWAITRSGEQFIIVNAGCNDANYTVKNLADAVASQIPGTTVDINHDAPPDRRSYRVDFSYLSVLAAKFIPQLSLADSISSLIDGITRCNHHQVSTAPSRLTRLHTLSALIETGKVNSSLYWSENSNPQCQSISEKLSTVS